MRVVRGDRITEILSTPSV